MRIIHIADFGTSENTGIAEVVSTLTERQLEKECDVLIIVLRTPKSYPNLIEINSSKKIIKEIESFSPDIVIFHSLYKYPYIRIAHFLVKRKIPYLIEMHGGSSKENANKSKFIKQLANRLFFNKFVRYSSAIIYLNNQEQNNSIFKHKNIIIPNGVDLRTVELNKKKLKGCSEKITFLFLGRIDFHHKGLDYLFEAINQLGDKLIEHNVCFKIYGRHYDDRILKIAAASNGLIEYHEPVFGTDKDNVMNSSDIFILTSRYEGMPMAVLEALAHGMPCLVTPQTNMGELINKNNAGWVCELNIEDIANTILKSISDYKNTRDSLSQNALNAVTEFDWDKIAELSIKQYSNFIEES